MTTVLYILAFIGFWTIASSAYIYLRDRTGNSGRHKHWTEE